MVPSREPPAIVTRDLTKTFVTAVRRPGFRGGLRSLVQPLREATTAVDAVSLQVRRGELVALLGPNGAGKSTTIKMLTGVLVPTSGELAVNGLVPHRDRIRNARTVGAVFGQRTQLWWDLAARESLAVLRDIFEIDDAAYRARLREFDDLLDLSSFWDTRVRHLSLGQRMRCDVAAALLHDPPIVFLDEPTIGMDVVVKQQVREFLRYQVAERGRTVLLTTHDMTEVSRLAERLLLINSGRLVFDGTLTELRHRFGATWQVRATLAEPVPEAELTRLVCADTGARLVSADHGRYTFAPDGTGQATPQALLRRLVARWEVLDLAIEEDDLEDVMRAAYRERYAPAAGSP